jgi:alkylated DNA nucleotide flippase Atl1
LQSCRIPEAKEVESAEVGRKAWSWSEAIDRGRVTTYGDTDPMALMNALDVSVDSGVMMFRLRVPRTS